MGHSVVLLDLAYPSKTCGSDKPSSSSCRLNRSPHVFHRLDRVFKRVRWAVAQLGFGAAAVDHADESDVVEFSGRKTREAQLEEPVEDELCGGVREWDRCTT